MSIVGRAARLSQCTIRSVDFLRTVSGELSLRLILTAQAIGALVNLLRYLQQIGSAGSDRQFVLNMIFTTVGALLIILASACAAEASRRGVPAFGAYALALLAASSCNAIVESISRQLYPHAAGTATSAPAPNEWVAFTLDVAYVVTVGGIAMLAYHNRRRATQILEGIRAAELKHVELERHLIESRLATAQAAIDPGALFASLASIRNLYATSAPSADRELDRLIEDLRDMRVASGVAPAMRDPGL